MKIGIDAHILGKNKGGVEVYLNNLIRGLELLDFKNDYVIYLNKSLPAKSFAGYNKNFCYKSLTFSSPWLRRSLSLPLAARKDKIDVLHVQRVLSLGFPGQRSIVSIYDIAQEIHPEFFDAKDSIIVRQLIKSSAKKAKSIITCSHASKNDIVARYNISPDKIIVAYPAVDSVGESIIDEEQINIFFKHKNIRQPFLLFVGAIEPRKNIDGAIEIMYSLKEKNQFSGSLVILGGFRAGIKKNYYPKLQAKVKAMRLEDSVIFMGYQNDQIKRMLMSRAFALVYPSFYEGFGIPILEAMTAGIPVIVSKIPVFLEIVKESGLYADPYNPEEFAEQINRLLQNRNLFLELVAKGKERVEMFSWEKAAKKHIEVYDSIKQY